MTATDSVYVFNPDLDLRLERVVPVPLALVWQAWTQPEHVTHWFTPAPWTTPHSEIDLRPGGIFRTVMRSPEGEEHDNVGSFLVVEPQRLLVFTDALGPGYRPTGSAFMTARIELAAEGADSTRYVATAIHKDTETRDTHEKMGFSGGWSTALDQLVAYMTEVRARS